MRQGTGGLSQSQPVSETSSKVCGCFFMQEWMQTLPGPQNSGPHLSLGSDLPITLRNTCRQPSVLTLTPAGGSPSLLRFFSRSGEEELLGQ